MFTWEVLRSVLVRVVLGIVFVSPVGAVLLKVGITENMLSGWIVDALASGLGVTAIVSAITSAAKTDPEAFRAKVRARKTR